MLGLIVFVVIDWLALFSWSRLEGPLIAVYAVILTLVIAELGLNVILGGPNEPALWPPGREVVLRPDPKLMPGVEGLAKFTGNNVGLRGSHFPVDSGQYYKIAAIGGSTTESLYLDDSEEWPRLLMDGINAQSHGLQAWVGNGGQSGRNTVDHLVLIRTLRILSEMDLLIFLIGLNDMQPALSFNGQSTQALLEANAHRFGEQVSNGGKRLRPNRPYFKRTELFELAKRSSAIFLDALSLEESVGWLGVGPGKFIEEKRSLRASATRVDLPDLRTALHEYADRVQTIGGECRKLRTRCLFLTQPTMWREDLSTYERDLLWFGWVQQEGKSAAYLPAEVLEDAMDAFNDQLIMVCEEIELECLDLARLVPKDVSSFYDDAHLNEEGSITVARLLTEYISSNPPFSNAVP